MPRRSRRCRSFRRTSSSPRCRSCRRRVTRNAERERKPQVIGSSSDLARSSPRPHEGRRNHDRQNRGRVAFDRHLLRGLFDLAPRDPLSQPSRSEEHTSELQSQSNLVCRLLLEKKNILDRIEFIGSYSGDEVIVVIQLAYIGAVAAILNIVTLDQHSAKRPPNALITQDVPSCD